MFISLFDTALNLTVLTTENTIGPALWYFFIIFLVIAGVILTILLFIISKPLENWEHCPITDSIYVKGNLTNLAESIRLNPVDYSNHSTIKNHIEMMFFEKIRTIHGFSIGEIIEMKNKDPNRLRAVINDNKISDWILNIKEKKLDQNVISKNRNKKKVFLLEMRSVLDKMDVWGE